MKITAVLLLAACLQVSARSTGQTVTLKVKDAPMKEVFREIQKQTGLDVLIDEALLQKAGRVTLDVRNMPVPQVLNICLKNEPLTYTIVDNRIVVKPAPNVVFRSAETLTPLSPIDVRGKVVDESGQSIEGVTVTEKGTRKATATNANGEFILKGVNENATLVFTGVQVETFEVAVSSRTNISVTLKTKVVALSDLAVTANTGFQTISRERSTGSYSVVSKEQLEKPSTNIAQRLIGQVSGLQARSLDINGNPRFEIRGQSGLLSNASPLIVVDGFPIQGDLNSVNPNDIESVTVLKDAAAASVWGARSANGVIVITTKRARKGTPLRVEFNAFTSVQAKMDLDYVRPHASSAETVEYEKLTYNNWRSLADPNGVLNVGFAYSRAGILLNEAKYGFITNAQRDAGLEALKNLDNRQQIRNHLLSNPTSTQFNLALSGGTERMSNNLSLMYEGNHSNFKGTDNKRYMVNFRSNSDITKWLGFNFTGFYLYNKANNNGVSLADIRSWSPYDMLLNSDGSLTDVHQYYTPLLQRHVPMDKFPYADWTNNPIREIANRDRTTRQTQARLQAALNFKILQGLTADVRGQYELGEGYTRNLSNENTFEVRSTVNHATTWNRTVTPNTFTLNLPKGGILNQSRNRTTSYNVRGQLNFNRIFAGRHEVNALSGIEFQNVTGETFTNPTAYGFNEATLGVGTFPNGPGGSFYPIRDWLGTTRTFPYVNSFGYTTQRLYSGYGNAGYTYDGKYTLTGSYRFDASNLITDDPEYRYAPFFSMGASWNIYKEKFMHNVKWVDRLTARLTFGHLGNYDPSTAVRPLISPSASSNIYINAFTAAFSSFGNPTLRWERTANWDLGLDFSLFKNKLFGRIDLYEKRGKDLIASLTIPSIYGTTSQRLN
ncbi:MAG TPA: SusC/RagA family TonB-linked outer membrane protein, partial [Chitinophagaceae bacterium]|nr:SusC/RagA family TonB-linked outer membrane protein [Chitinophagaceae bacterium]